MSSTTDFPIGSRVKVVATDGEHNSLIWEDAWLNHVGTVIKPNDRAIMAAAIFGIDLDTLVLVQPDDLASAPSSDQPFLPEHLVRLEEEVVA